MKLTDLQAYMEELRSAIPAIHDVIPATAQDELAEKIRDLLPEKTHLVYIIPSSDTRAPSVDDVMEIHTCILFIIESASPREMQIGDYITFMEKMRTTMAAVKQKMTDDRHDHTCPSIMHYMDPNNMHTDPEYNYFGTYGYSLSFSLTTPGY